MLISITKILSELSAQPSDLLQDAISNIYTLKQRSLLALIGIAIGTASVVALLTIGHMAEQEVTKIFRASGIDMLLVQLRATDAETVTLDPRTIATLPSRQPGIQSAAPLVTGDSPANISGNTVRINVAAITPLTQKISGLRLRAGRLLNSVDKDNLVALVGINVAEKVSHSFPQYAVGDLIRLGNYNFKIVGVIEPRFSTAFDPIDYNEAAVIPIGSAHRVLPSSGVNAAVIRLHQNEDADKEAAKLTTILQEYSQTSSLQVSSARQFIHTMNAQKAVQMRLLAAIGGVSLLVGGIGVMNVMLMGMMERRREIGIRAAIGATPRDIQVMFLAEATILALCGGIIGTLLGIAIAFFVAQASSWEFSIAVYALPLGIGLATSVGIIFGMYPAIKASRQDPIEALRVA